MTPGSIILYKSTGKWYERAIMLATNGPYVHAEILLDDTKTIGEQITGVCVRMLPQDTAHYTVCSLPSIITDEARQKGLTWAWSMRGKPYGWLDIIDAGLRYISKNTFPFHLVEDGHYDCSCFVVRYLEIIGVQLPSSMLDAHQVSPNDIARYFELISNKN